MKLERCCECEAPTGRAGAGDGSLYAGGYGPYCEDCWGDVPDMLADLIYGQQATITTQQERIAELDLALKWIVKTSHPSLSVSDIHRAAEKALLPGGGE